jgi:hypothetical protein
MAWKRGTCFFTEAMLLMPMAFTLLFFFMVVSLGGVKQKWLKAISGPEPLLLPPRDGMCLAGLLYLYPESFFPSSAI